MKGRFWKDCCADGDCVDCISHDYALMTMINEVLTSEFEYELMTTLTQRYESAGFTQSVDASWGCRNWVREEFGNVAGAWGRTIPVIDPETGLQKHFPDEWRFGRFRGMPMWTWEHSATPVCLDLPLKTSCYDGSSSATWFTDNDTYGDFQRDPKGWVLANKDMIISRWHELGLDDTCSFWRATIRCLTNKCLSEDRNLNYYGDRPTGNVNIPDRGDGYPFVPWWINDVGIVDTGDTVWEIDATLPDGFFGNARCNECSSLNGATIRLRLNENLCNQPWTGLNNSSGHIHSELLYESYQAHTACHSNTVAEACIEKFCALEPLAPSRRWWPFKEFDPTGGPLVCPQEYVDFSKMPEQWWSSGAYIGWDPLGLGDNPEVCMVDLAPAGAWIGGMIDWPVERWVSLHAGLYVRCNEEDKDYVLERVGGEEKTQEVEAGTCNICLGITLYTGHEHFWPHDRRQEWLDIKNLWNYQWEFYDEHGVRRPSAWRFGGFGQGVTGFSKNLYHQGIRMQTWQWRVVGVKPSAEHELKASQYYDQCLRSNADWDQATSACDGPEDMICSPRFGGGLFGETSVPRASNHGPFDSGPVTIRYIPTGLTEQPRPFVGGG